MNYLPYDFDELKKQSIPELWADLTMEKYRRISSELIAGFLEVLPSLNTSELPESEIETQYYIDNLMENAPANFTPYFHFLHYWATLSGVSCHEIMYNGCKHLIELQGASKYVVERWRTLAAADKEPLIQYLKDNRDVITNPIYTLYMRSEELAAIRSETVENFWKDFTTKPGPLRYCRKEFPHGKADRHEKFHSYRTYLDSNISMWWIVWLLCPGLDLSVDFFAMQDYSHLATIGGEFLASDEQQFLSSFLYASEKAQRHIIATMICDTL